MRTSVILVALALLASVASASSTTPGQYKPAGQRKPKADAISGEWDAALAGPNNARRITLKLKLEGDKVTGQSESAHLGNGAINGLWANNKLKITVETNHALLTLTGALQNGKPVGEWDAGHAQGKWEAKKK